MKKSTIVVIIVLAIVVLWLIFKPSSASAPVKPDTLEMIEPIDISTEATATDQISIGDFAFQPAAVSVSPGATVTWTNNDQTVHSVLVDGESSLNLQPGATYSHTFATAGTYAYSCGVHPSMTGTVTVQ